MSLFRGRDDVYAKRWQNKVGKSWYSPVCLNEWVNRICNKPKIKCSDCENRNYAVLDFAAIDSHLRGKTVLGIYPMLLDETCYFLAMDFDDEGWQKDVSVLRDICNTMDIPFALERSQSGNGAHLWFFFKEQISAATVRKFGTLLLTQLIRLSSIPPDENIVIVATGRFVGEGFDEPRLDTLFLAMPVAWKGTVQQYAGRLHRLYQTKHQYCE